MFAERFTLQEKSFEPYDEIFGDDGEDFLKACRFASQFYGQTPDENLLWVRALEMPENKHFRVKVGFDVDAQIAGSLKIYSDMMRETRGLTDIQEAIINAAYENYLGYNFEFVTRDPVMRNPIKRINDRIIAYRYNNMPLEEIPDESERDGVYIETINLLVKELAHANPGDVFAITSPKGWAFTDEDGQEYEFPESQTYLYRINKDNELEAITVRTDMSTSEHEDFLRAITKGGFQPNDKHSNKERLKHISGALAKRANMDFSDVIAVMREVTNRDVAWTDNGKRRVTFDEIISKVRNLNELYLVDEKVEEILENFKDRMKDIGYIKSEEDVLNLMALMGKTALEISHAHGLKTGRIKIQKTAPMINSVPVVSSPPIDFIAESQHNSEQDGCMLVASGNGKWQKTALGARLVNSAEIRILCCECPVCHEEVEAEIYDGEIHCPKCKASAAYSD